MYYISKYYFILYFSVAIILLFDGIFNQRKPGKKLYKILSARIFIATSMIIILNSIWHIVNPFIEFKEKNFIVNESVFSSRYIVKYKNIISLFKDSKDEFILEVKENSGVKRIEISLSIVLDHDIEQIWEELNLRKRVSQKNGVISPETHP